MGRRQKQCNKTQGSWEWCFNRESKSCVCKPKIIRNSLFSIGWQMSNHFLESRASVHIMLPWEDKHPHHKFSSFLLSFSCPPTSRKKVNSIPDRASMIFTPYSIPFASHSGPTLSDTSKYSLSVPFFYCFISVPKLYCVKVWFNFNTFLYYLILLSHIFFSFLFILFFHSWNPLLPTLTLHS